MLLECDGVLTTPSVKMHIVMSRADATVCSAALLCFTMQQNCSASALLCINIAAACSLGDTYSLLKCIYAGSTLWGLLQIQLLHTYYTHQQCAVLIRQKAHKQSHMHQQRQLAYNGSILLRCALCWQTQHLCTKLEVNLVQSAPPLWLINNAGLLESTMWKDAFLQPASTLWGLVHQLQPFYASTFRRLVRASTTHCDWCVLKNFLLFIMFIRFG